MRPDRPRLRDYRRQGSHSPLSLGGPRWSRNQMLRLLRVDLPAKALDTGKQGIEPSRLQRSSVRVGSKVCSNLTSSPLPARRGCERARSWRSTCFRTFGRWPRSARQRPARVSREPSHHRVLVPVARHRSARPRGRRRARRPWTHFLCGRILVTVRRAVGARRSVSSPWLLPGGLISFKWCGIICRR